MNIAMAPHDSARMAYARAAFLRAYQWQLELDVIAGHIPEWNASLNLHQMRERWATENIIDWAKSMGLAPIWLPLPPKLGPGFPPLKESLRNYGGTVFASRRYGPGENQQLLRDADPTCTHLWMVNMRCGVECNDCRGWFDGWRWRSQLT